MDILKSEALISKELAERLNISEQDTRTYLLRLKKEDRVRVVQKIGRYNIYTYKMPYDFVSRHTKLNALEYDLSYLLNLIEMKMTLKEGVAFSSSDLVSIKRIKDRITEKKENISKGMEIVKEFAEFEHTFRNEINAKIAELEAKVKTIESKEESD